MGTSYTTLPTSVVDRTTETACEEILKYSPGSTKGDQVPWRTAGEQQKECIAQLIVNAN